MIPEYNAKLVKVIDGDTFDLMVDHGFRIYSKIRFRLIKVDTPELNSSDEVERKAAIRAMNFVEGQFRQYGNSCRIYSHKTGTFNRWLADVYFIDDIGRRICLRKLLLETGHGKAYEGRS